YVVLRVVRHEVKAAFSIPEQDIAADTIISVTVMGFEFTQDKWGLVGEYGLLDFDDPEGIDPRESTSAYYLTLYTESGQWTPLITYSASKADTSEGIYKGESFSTGIRYDVNEVTSMKVEVLRGEILDGLTLTVIAPTAGFDDKVTVLSASISLIF
ncbi:MAG: hypothetical protein JKY67_21740, partial [Pseudomonadales bacterium]|nr:hypothetical protein [Pseudomonadales bacterium]